MNEKIYIEIRSGEGGCDSKLLVKEMVAIYQKAAMVEGFKVESLSEKLGYASICL
jgi:protein subunit release factor A